MTLDVYERIKRAGEQARGFKPESVLPDVLITDEGATGLDSMGRVEMTLALEEEFGVSFGDGDMDGVGSFKDLAILIERKMSENGERG